MKKSLILLVSVFVLGLGVFIGCGKDDEDKKNDNRLPTGWWAIYKTIPAFVDYNNLHVGDSFIAYTVVYNDKNEIVTDYDTSSTVWIVEPEDTVTLSDNVGSTTQFTAAKAGTLTLKWEFKGIVSDYDITIQP
jgi:hypothetical protein